MGGKVWLRCKGKTYIAGHCQQFFESKKFVDITQQCFALLPHRDGRRSENLRWINTSEILSQCFPMSVRVVTVLKLSTYLNNYSIHSNSICIRWFRIFLDFKVSRYFCSLHNTLIPNLVKPLICMCSLKFGCFKVIWNFNFSCHNQDIIKYGSYSFIQYSIYIYSCTG